MAEYKDLKSELSNCSPFEQLLEYRLFYTESFEIYRTSASGLKEDNRGFYAYGPLGCALQSNKTDLWRRYFVIEEDMLENDDVILTPEDGFPTSRHVDKFADWVCKDHKKGECLRPGEKLHLHPGSFFCYFDRSLQASKFYSPFFSSLPYSDRA